MKTLDRIKGISKDFLYSFLGVAMMNGVMQLALYPYLQRRMGAGQWGDVLTLLAVVSVMGTTFGTGANYSRMVAHTRRQDSDSDYQILLLYVSVPAAVVSCAGLYWMQFSTIRTYIGYYLLMCMTILRYYADVEFRLRTDYRRYCLFYTMIGAGYLLGMAVYPLSGSWILTILLGECAAVFYVKCRGNVLSGALKKSDYYLQNRKSLLQLTGTQLLANIVFNSDRLLLNHFCGGTAVTIFYVATLIGKIISLISAPLNGVLIGYLARYQGGAGRKIFIKLGMCLIPLGIVLTVACTGMSYIFIRLMYEDIFEMVSKYLWIANAGQVFFFLSGILIVVLMRFTDEKYQIYVNGIYGILFFALAVPLTIRWKLWGMAVSVLLSNFARIILIVCIGEKYGEG